MSCIGLTVHTAFHLVIGSAPAPGGPAPIAFPFVIVGDDEVRRKGQAMSY